ncbi:hypothetical protein BN8_03369 [Fibrisoma limi BUZ 3]|uniref:Lipocalin-like domain-containing protein n=1 Tax=Fibrisoma limi BUZ 3 TaxID=1185876 RepID=I2GJZ6_9BACT|nr:hypothetical protein [Fibrisoma limi]CCH54221.1 hypothetical protein BN8_03369 [Fibrisoma limi BUZ 3]
MKKLFIYSLLAAVLFGNSGAGCSRKNEDDPQPQARKLFVGGLWEVTETSTHMPNDRITLQLKPGALGFRFYTDGKLESCSYGTCVLIGRWSFKEGQANTNQFIMYLDSPDPKEIYGDMMEGPVAIISDNHVDWLIRPLQGQTTIGDTDATSIRWTMKRNP